MLDIKQLLLRMLGMTEYKALLWTNPSPNASFDAQTISLDLSNYDYVEVVAKYLYSRNSIGVSQKVEVGTGDGTYLIVPLAPQDAASAKYNAVRGITASATGVTFGNGGYYRWSTTDSDLTLPSYCIPLKIYGTKIIGGGYRLKAFSAPERGWANA